MKLNLKIFKKSGASIDALLLTMVRVITMLMGFVCIKIVSVFFSLESYGLYAQALLIISTVTSLSILGMTDAVNYFFNNSRCHNEYSKNDFIGTIFTLQTIIGGIFGIAILAGGPLLSDYFQNPELWSVYGWIAFQPLLTNYIAMLQILYISCGRAKSIALLNLIISFFRLVIFAIASFVTCNIVTILALTLVSDIVQVLYFIINLYKHGITIDLRKFQLKLCHPILAYAVPMAAFVIINSLMRDADKWIIGYFATTDDLAIYTNCSKLLPFDMLTYSFCIVLVPIITRNIINNTAKVRELFGNYLNMGFLTTSILVIPAIFLSRDMLLCLYDAKYLPGLSVFILYLLVDFTRFANISLLYNASGRTRQLLWIVLFTFGINIILAILLYKIIGLAGPALATLISMWISYICYINGSGKILGKSILGLFDYKAFGIVIIECSALGLSGYWFSEKILYTWNAVPRFLLIYTLIVIISALFNKTKIMTLIRALNKA